MAVIQILIVTSFTFFFFFARNIKNDIGTMIILLQTLNFTLAELKLKNLNLLTYLSKSQAQ